MYVMSRNKLLDPVHPCLIPLVTSIYTLKSFTTNCHTVIPTSITYQNACKLTGYTIK